MPRSGVISRLPPRRLLALPIEATVMSIVWPGFENGGRSARTVTAATFFSCGFTFAGIVHAELREHVPDALDRERRLARLVARAVETDDEAVADELVAAHARDRREILDALGVRRSRSASDGSRERASRDGVQVLGQYADELRTAVTAS